jgi:hypothetical protein
MWFICLRSLLRSGGASAEFADRKRSKRTRVAQEQLLETMVDRHIDINEWQKLDCSRTTGYSETSY